MTRRLGLASLIVVAFAFAGTGASTVAGPARPLQRIVVSVAWPHAPEQAEHKTRPIATSVAQPSASKASPAPRPVSLRRFLGERWLFQRPPPVAL
jgi:hypothetical protein